MRKVWLGYLALVVFVLAFANFMLFAFTDSTPVPVLVSHPLGMVAGGYLGFQFMFPWLLGRRGVGRVLPPPGPPVATYRCAGRIGRVKFSGRLITATVYADRLTLHPRFLGDYTIHGSDIRSITDDRVLWSRAVVITHVAPDVASPVALLSLPADIRDQLSWIRRDPPAGGIAEHANPTPDSRAERTARRRIELALFVFGIAAGLGFIGFGVVQMMRAPHPFYVVWLAFALVIEIQVVREFGKRRRQD